MGMEGVSPQRGMSLERRRGSVCNGGDRTDQVCATWKGRHQGAAGSVVVCGSGATQVRGPGILKGRPQEPWMGIGGLTVRGQWGQITFSRHVNPPSLLPFLFPSFSFFYLKKKMYLKTSLYSVWLEKNNSLAFGLSVWVDVSLFPWRGKTWQNRFVCECKSKTPF